MPSLLCSVIEPLVNFKFTQEVPEKNSPVACFSLSTSFTNLKCTSSSITEQSVPFFFYFYIKTFPSYFPTPSIQSPNLFSIFKNRNTFSFSSLVSSLFETLDNGRRQSLLKAIHSSYLWFQPSKWISAFCSLSFTLQIFAGYLQMKHCCI